MSSDFTNPKAVTNWFNIHDITHLRAYQRLCNTGSWPVGFIPADIVFPTNWQFALMSQMADAWVETQLPGATAARSVAPDDDLMTIEDFKGAVRRGSLIDYDGFGKYSDGEFVYADKPVSPGDDIDPRFSHVVWYNR